MLAKKPLLYFNNEKKDHQKRRQYQAKYPVTRPYFPSTQHNYDIRLIILRHAERIDHVLGSDWYDKVFNGVPSASKTSYRHPSLPYRLPQRSKTFLYIVDPPISRLGEQQAFAKGQQLTRTGVSVDYCYSSPASRSILTANGLLKGMNRSQVPIRLEPCLFEPMTWNSALETLGQVHPFMSKTDWQQTGYNIDSRYQCFSNILNMKETENDYFKRSLNFFNSIVQHHGRSLIPGSDGQASRRRLTILLVGHASSTEMFSTIALRQPFDAKTLTEQSNKVPYLHTAVLERDAITHNWYLRPYLSYL